jgi:hypothetical protein
VVVPQVAIRTAVFVALHDSAAFPSGAGSEAQNDHISMDWFKGKSTGNHGFSH